MVLLTSRARFALHIAFQLTGVEAGVCVLVIFSENTAHAPRKKKGNLGSDTMTVLAPNRGLAQV
jgi:hypothetical protein